MYEDGGAQFDFFPGNIYDFIFSDKINPNFKNFASVGFCGPEVFTKYLDSACYGLVMDFYTHIHKMSQMHDFH